MQPADIAWILAAAAMVLLMFPGLAFLYGGMLDDRNVLNMLMMVMSGLAVGGVAYAIKKPNPWPGVFGYHEVFHAMTIVAAICHYIAVYFAMYNSPFV